MNEATLALVLSALGVVAFLLMEGFKIIAEVLGKEIPSVTKLKVALIVSFTLGVVAGLASGQLDVAALIEAASTLPSEPSALFVAISELLKDIIAFAGVVQLIGQAVYALLKERMKEKRILSFS